MRQKTPKLFHVVAGFVVGVVVAAIPGRSVACDLSILTSYPSSFYEPFVRLFKERSGSSDICIQNKNTIGLIAHIREKRRPVPDVVWASSPVAFELLNQAGGLAKFPDKRMPFATNAGIEVDAPDGSRFGFALSTIGVMFSFDEADASVPREIADLARPEYAGLLGMSSPSRSGTTHLFVESLLQQYGWEDGWALLSRIGGNLATVTARSFGVRDGVSRSRFKFGIGIDFLAHARLSSEEPLAFSSFLPAWTFPASVAVTSLGANNDLSLQFVDFLRSREAQELLLAPGIRRIPIDPDLWSAAGFSPGTETPNHRLDLKLAAQRMNVVNALFDDMITHRLLEIRRLWDDLHRLENTPVIVQSDSMYALLEAVRKSLEAVPVAAFMADGNSFDALFATTVPSEASVVGRMRIQDSWSNDFSQRFKIARELIARMDSFQNHSGARGVE